MKNLQYHVSQGLDITETPLWFLLELFPCFGNKFWGQGTRIGGWWRSREPAVPCGP